MHLINLVGKRFGHWLVLHRTQGNGTTWVCKCDCGTISSVNENSMRRGLSTSCGCAPNIRALTHGKCGTSEYNIWNTMIRRCHTPTNTSYDNYGGRGITVCPRWRISFESFFSDMGPRPGPNYSIDRKDNNGNYSPDNCCWSTPEIQTRNKRNQHLITYGNRTLCLTDWAIELGVSRGTIFTRIQAGYSIEQAFSKILNPNRTQGHHRAKSQLKHGHHQTKNPLPKVNSDHS